MHPVGWGSADAYVERTAHDFWSDRDERDRSGGTAGFRLQPAIPPLERRNRQTAFTAIVPLTLPADFPAFNMCRPKLSLVFHGKQYAGSR